MNRIGTNYKASSAGELQGPGRVVLHEALALTGSEISINELPAGASIPFVHSHKRNEEVYIILEGKGRFHVDGDEFEVGEGTVVRVDPAGARCLKAGDRARCGMSVCRPRPGAWCSSPRTMASSWSPSRPG